MLIFRPLTVERWPDLESLFGDRGACGGCWCMWYRVPRRTYEAGKGRMNRTRLRALVQAGQPTGVLAYEQQRPVGWCSVAPRSQYGRLATARTMKPVDARPLWSILCLFVDASARGRGTSVALLKHAARWARQQGAPGVEAFPIVAGRGAVAPVFASQGTLRAYLRAGFREVARPSATRAIVVWP